MVLLDAQGQARALALPTLFGDTAYFLLVLAFALSNGWLGTMLLMCACVQPGVRQARRVVGDVMVVSLACGLTLGSFVSFGIRAAMCGCNPFVS